LRGAKKNYNCLTKLDGVKDKFAKTWKVLNFIITQTKLQLICLTRVCSTWKSVMVKTDSFCLPSASHQLVGEYQLAAAPRPLSCRYTPPFGMLSHSCHQICP